MRRRDITDQRELEEIIRKCQWCHMAMCDPDGNPYVLPMNFGYKDGIIYMHGAAHGKKISLLQLNPRVCVNFSTDHTLRYQSEQVACSWSMLYRSVLAYGKVSFISGTEEKIAALHIIMAQYAERSFQYNPPSLREVNVWQIVTDHLEGRAFGL